MKPAVLSSLLALASLMGVVALLWADLDRTSPGPLARAHAEEPELASPDGCALCHGALGESMGAACASCHAEIGMQLEDGSGLHGTLTDVDGRDCDACHGEHHGARFDLIGDAAFQVAGFEGRAGFDHARLGYDPAGRHAELGCADCHERAELDARSTGGARYLDLDTACHEDVHAGRIAWACADCHAPGGAPPRALGPALGTDCASCHGDPHVAQFSELGRTNCVRCHDTGGALRFDHQRDARFALDEHHEDLACSACHRPTPLPGGGAAVRYKPLGLECGDCHGSPGGPER